MTTMTQTPKSDRGSLTVRAAGRLAVAGAAGFMSLLGALHVVRADLDPSWRVISEYAIGRHGWLMNVAFCLLAVASGALAIAVWSEGSPVLGRIGSILLAVTTIGLTMAAVFVTDPITMPPGERSVAGRLHEVGALLDLTPIAAVVVSSALLRGTTASRRRRLALIATMLVPMGGLVVFTTATVLQLPAAGVGSPTVLIGWPNRLLIVSYCVWFVTAGWYLMGSDRRPRDTRAPRTAR